MSEPTEPVEPTEPTELIEPVGDDGATPLGEPVAAPAAASPELPDDAPQEGSPRSKVGWIVGAAVAAVVVLVVVVVALVARPAPAYGDATRQRFLAACTADGGADVQGPCGCLYDKLSTTMPYDRFVDVDQQLKAQFPSTPQGQDLSLPPDVQAAVEACRTTR